MSFIFKNALVRKPSESISRAISSRGIAPNYLKVCEEHKKYVEALNLCGLEVNILGSLEDFPDSIFIEDPALIYNHVCIILKPGTHSRFGESKALEKDVTNRFNEVLFIDNGNIEGGDVLRIKDHFIIGLSERTNETGAKELSEKLNFLGASSEISNTPQGVLHFKSDCSLVDEETILITKKMKNTRIFSKSYRIIEVPDGEELAANTIRVNDSLLIPSGFKKTEDLLSKYYNLKIMKVTEISKVDAGLSCMSLRW